MGINTTTNETTSLVKDITQTILIDGIETTIIICKLSCHIVGNTSISYIMRVLDLDKFNENKEIIQEEIDAFKIQAQNLAKTYNVPII
jgi:hypothetical protein